MSSDINVTAQHWSNHVERFSGRNAGLFWWEAGSEVDRHINSKISGEPDVDWLEYSLRKYFDGRLPLTRCLSLGCGSGHLERTLAQLGAFQHCDAYDVAEGSIQAARKLAEMEGFGNITYYISDVNKLTLQPTLYDAVWIYSAMHHFEALENVCQQIKRSLKPGGLLFLNEYFGPSRFQFSSRQKELANACLLLLPTKYRTIVQEQVELEIERTPFKKGWRWFASRLIDKLREGNFIEAIQRRFLAYKARASGQALVKTAIAFPSSSDVIATDPSEAVRSAEIIKVLQQDFEIVEKRDWGGNLLQFLLAGIAGNFSNEEPCSQVLLRMLIDIEDTLLQCGEFQSDFAYIVARPLTT